MASEMVENIVRIGVDEIFINHENIFPPLNSSLHKGQVIFGYYII